MKYQIRGFEINIDFSKDVKRVYEICKKWGWHPDRHNFHIPDEEKIKLWDELINPETIRKIKNTILSEANRIQ